MAVRQAGRAGTACPGPSGRALHASTPARASSSTPAPTSLLSSSSRARLAPLHLALAASAAAAAGTAGYVWAGQRHPTPEGAPPTSPAGSTAAAPQPGAAPAAPPVDRAALLADLRAWLVANGADVEAIDIRPCSEVKGGETKWRRGRVGGGGAGAHTRKHTHSPHLA